MSAKAGDAVRDVARAKAVEVLSDKFIKFLPF
jgi:hypothetical protein